MHLNCLTSSAANEMALQEQFWIYTGLCGLMALYVAVHIVKQSSIPFTLHLHSLLPYYYFIFFIYVLPGTPANIWLSWNMKHLL